MKYIYKAGISALALVIVIVGGMLLLDFNGEDDFQPGELIEGVEIDLESRAQVVLGNNQFALDLYSFYQSRDQNIFFSPYSISTALAMTYEGARGVTAEEMASVLHFPEQDSVRQVGFANLHNLVNQPNAEYRLRTANAIWPEENYSFLQDYLSVIGRYYRGGINFMNYSTQAEESRLEINNWVELQTQEKIKDLIPQGAIGADTRMVLTNAIYFKGDWMKEFDVDSTRDQDFYLSEDRAVPVSMMRKSDDFSYGEVDQVQVLSLPYRGQELRMLLLLPELGELGNLQDSLSLNQLEIYRESLVEREVVVDLPKFKLETKYFMADDLIEMGMPTAFGFGQEDPDFSGMTGGLDLFIDSVIHQAFVEVDEQGTEAAAATAVIIMEIADSIDETPVFRADRPFIFIIEHSESGAILFMGRLTNPA
jgi:serpin B